MGYTPADLHEVSFYGMATGSMCEVVNLRGWDTFLVGPAKGAYGVITLDMVLAMGVNVIAMSRNRGSLEAPERKLGYHEHFSYVSGEDAADAAVMLEASHSGRSVEVYDDWAWSAVERLVVLLCCHPDHAAGPRGGGGCLEQTAGRAHQGGVHAGHVQEYSHHWQGHSRIFFYRRS